MSTEQRGEAEAPRPNAGEPSGIASPHSEGPPVANRGPAGKESEELASNDTQLSPRSMPLNGLAPTAPQGFASADPGPTQSPSAFSPTSDSNFPSSSLDGLSSSGAPVRPAANTRSLSYKTDQSSNWSSASNPSRSDTQRTTRAASDGAVLNTGFGSAATAAFVPSGEPGRAAGGTRLSSLGSEGSSSSEEQAFFREHQRRSLESTANQQLSSVRSFASPPLASARLSPGATSPFFQPPSFVQNGTNAGSASGLGTPASTMPPLLSPSSTSPPTSSFAPSSASSSYLSSSATQTAGSGENGPPGSKGATLHLGDLDVWMDELYVRECCALMGWDNVVSIKMSRGARSVCSPQPT